MVRRPPSKPPAGKAPKGPRRPETGARAPLTPRERDSRALAAWGVKEDKPKKPARPARGAKPVSAKGTTTRADSRPNGRKAIERPAPQRKPRPPRSGKAPSAHIANPHPARAAAKPGEGPQRIAKLLARAGIASRREIERMIEEGRIALNGEPIDTPATLLTDLRGVTVDGNPVAAPEAARLFLFHKPSGCLTTERDPAGRPTIYDRLPDGLPRVMPVGRLDMGTEGLLLLTTDGELKRALELPANGVERTYRARAFGTVTQAQLEELIDGVEVEGVRYGRIDANLERRTGHNQWIEMTLTEGKNREVRRVLEYLGLKVNRLIRTRYGPFDLGDSAPGAVQEVHGSEIGRLLRTLGIAK